MRPDASEAGPRTVTVRRGELVELATASGTVEPDVQVEVKPRASGEVIEVLVSEGDQVKVGDLLVRLDPIDAERGVREARVTLTRAQAELAQARAQLLVAQAEARQAETQADVRGRGAKLGLISDEERRTAATSAEVARANQTLRSAQLRSAQAQVEAARLAVDEAERRLSEMEIRAPVSGTVLAVAVERGSIASSGITNIGGGTAMLTLADLSDLRVIGDLDEAQVGKVREGQPVTVRVDAYPGRQFRGKVHRVSPLGVETSNVVTFDVEVVVTDEDAHLLRSGMSADLEIVTTRYEEALLIPITALKGRNKRRFVVMASGEQRPVKTGATDGIHMVVLSGLEEGEKILGSGGGGGGARPERGRRGPLPFGPKRPRGSRKAGR